MTDLSHFFSQDGFMPHGHCYLWNADLVWTMILTDSSIFLAYAAISWCLYTLVKKIELPFSAMIIAFGVFIAACGLTHAMEVWTLWNPTYWIAAFVKILTALASVITAVWFFLIRDKIVLIAHSARSSEAHRLQLERQTHELAKAKDSAEAANQELEAFSYSVAHDLRAPLRSMMGFSNAVLDDLGTEIKPQVAEDIKRVINATKKMGDLVDGLLSLSRLSRGEIHNESVNLSQIATTVIEDLKKAQPERKSTFIVPKDILVTGDTQLLQAVMTNLLSNAWKFTAKKADALIEFGQENESGLIRYYVRDNGAGFDMQYANKLFVPFQRLHSEKEFAGHGIGLATVQRIIKRHGGQIWVLAKPNEGATFYFTTEKIKSLPLVPKKQH